MTSLTASDTVEHGRREVQEIAVKLPSQPLTFAVDDFAEDALTGKLGPHMRRLAEKVFDLNNPEVSTFSEDQVNETVASMMKFLVTKSTIMTNSYSYMMNECAKAHNGLKTALEQNDEYRLAIAKGFLMGYIGKKPKQEKVVMHMQDAGYTSETANDIANEVIRLWDEVKQIEKGRR